LRVTSLLAPTKLGFGVGQGSEAAAHAVRRFKDLGPGMAMFKLYFTIAFNSIRRDDMMQAVRHIIPELLYFVSTCYEKSSHLCLDRDIITSDEGVQQGDPLGPLLFCLTALELTSN
jgi:hypothetical protein